MVATSLASMLGISIESDDPTPNLIAYLCDRRLLLILDNCEHLIETAASLAARIFLAAPQVHILATSREALRVEGERVHRLTPLGFPPDEPGLTAALALTFPAIQLFVERAAASGARLELSDADARHRGEHLPEARRRGARDRACGRTGRGLRAAADRGAARPAPDPAVAGTAHRAGRGKRPCRPR